MKQFISEITRKKHLQHVADTQKNNDLHRTLTAVNLTSMGVGAVVGAGVFVITGQAAAIAAGPALALSFIVSAVSCFFSGICYAEMAAAIPISGSAYTFTYVAVGEFAAWMVAICLSLEYLIATAAVSVGWSGSVQSFLAEFGVSIPDVFAKAPIEIEHSGSLGLSGSIVNLPAVIINVIIAVVLCLGVRESATFNNIFVLVKLSVLFIFITYGVYFAFSNSDTFADNLTPFIPENTGKFGQFGISGIFRGAGMVFFSYVGFDAVCAMAQECKNPARDLPRGLLFTLTICTVLYVVVTLFLTGMAHYTTLNVDDPVPFALSAVGAPPIVRYCVDIGAISGLTSVCLISLMCMPRLMYTLSNDGLLPAFLASVHPKYKTPFVSTVICGVLSALIGGLLPLDVLGELVSAGTLMAFMFVCYSVISFRRRHPEYPRPFKVPLVPYFPALGIALCAVQITSLPPRTLIYYALLQLGLFGIYVLYGKERSVAKRRVEVRLAVSRGASRAPSRIPTPQTRTPTTRFPPSSPSPHQMPSGFGPSGPIVTRGLSYSGATKEGPADASLTSVADGTAAASSLGGGGGVIVSRGGGFGGALGAVQVSSAHNSEDEDGAAVADDVDDPRHDYTDREMDSEAEAEAMVYGLAGAKASPLRTASYARRLRSVDVGGEGGRVSRGHSASPMGGRRRKGPALLEGSEMGAAMVSRLPPLPPQPAQHGAAVVLPPLRGPMQEEEARRSDVIIDEASLQGLRGV